MCRYVSNHNSRERKERKREGKRNSQNTRQAPNQRESNRPRENQETALTLACVCTEDAWQNKTAGVVCKSTRMRLVKHQDKHDWVKAQEPEHIKNGPRTAWGALNPQRDKREFHSSYSSSSSNKGNKTQRETSMHRIAVLACLGLWGFAFALLFRLRQKRRGGRCSDDRLLVDQVGPSDAHQAAHQQSRSRSTNAE